MKNIMRLFILITVLPCLGLTAAPQAFALTTGQSADIVVGQANMTSNSGNQGGTLGPNTLNKPVSAIRADNRLIVADGANHRVLIYNTFPTVNNASANLVIGQPNLTSIVGGLTGNRMSWPVAVFYDGAHLFISDTLYHRVLIYNGIPSANNAFADVVVGQPNSYTGVANYEGITRRTLFYPHYACSDGTRLFIADSYNNRVLIFNSIPTGYNTAADVVVGQADGNTNPAGSDAARLNYPSGILVDNGRLYVSDANNNRILVYSTIPSADGAPASQVIGQVNLTGNLANQPDGLVSMYGLYFPHHLSIDDGILYACDGFNNRVLVYNPVPSVNGAAAHIVIGQPNSYTAAAVAPQADRFNFPTGVQHASGQLLVADYNNHRVLIFNEPTMTFTATPTSTVTRTPTRTATATRTASPTGTITPTVTHTPTITPTGTITQTATRTATVLPTQTATARAPEISGDVIAYPAPARGESVWFYYRTAGPARVTVEIYNAAGERAAALADEAAEGGNHRLCWDIRQTAPGVYVYRLKTASAAGEHAGEWRKLAIVR